jgi:hypothetical protein
VGIVQLPDGSSASVFNAVTTASTSTSKRFRAAGDWTTASIPTPGLRPRPLLGVPQLRRPLGDERGRRRLLRPRAPTTGRILGASEPAAQRVTYSISAVAGTMGTASIDYNRPIPMPERRGPAAADFDGPGGVRRRQRPVLPQLKPLGC